MEWNSFQELISYWKRSTILTGTKSYGEFTIDIINDIDKVVLFLNDFYETPQDCESQFPKGGTLLTDMAHIRILVMHPIICKLLIKCIIEYSKFFSNFPETLENPTSRIKNWCAERLHGFLVPHVLLSDNSSISLSDHCGVGSYDLFLMSFNESVSTITEFLERINSECLVMPPQYFVKITEQCLLFLEDLSMLKFIDLIIRTATKINLNNTSYSNECEVLSCEFVEKLIFSGSSTFDKLSIEAKSGIWASCPISVEHEIMKIFGNILFPTEKEEYMTPNNIREIIRNELFFERIFVHPKICHICFDVLTNLINETPDWRIFRLVRITIQFIFDGCITRNDQNDSIPITKYFSKSFSKLILVLTNENEIFGSHNYSMINSSLNQFLTDLNPSDIEMFRKKEWIILMSFPKWYYWIIKSIFDIENYPHLNELEAPLQYLSWLIYPREDGFAIILKNTLIEIINYIRGK
ncbi:5705_t:CDS:2 [Diversispora eburnea]|uniref:5705_t:CDS:1 n=1 Tax=Diversispora eburnea TaxID=1213867 RepID=A0A9N8VZU9_9GLOM|nr:5705_t:CDS:2 [Diversispora eburnea]